MEFLKKVVFILVTLSVSVFFGVFSIIIGDPPILWYVVMAMGIVIHVYFANGLYDLANQAHDEFEEKVQDYLIDSLINENTMQAQSNT